MKTRISVGLAVTLVALFGALQYGARAGGPERCVMARYVEVGGTLEGSSIRSGGPFDEAFWGRCITDESATCIPVLIVETINGNVFDVPVARECFDSMRPGDPWPPAAASSPCRN